MPNLFQHNTFTHVPLSRGSTLSRDPWIESLRGVTILLVVLFHAMYDRNEAIRNHGGLASLQHVVDWLALIRMPLFMAISGFVSTLSRKQFEMGTRWLVADKTRRLLVPFLSTVTLTLLIRLGLSRFATGQGSLASDPLSLISYYFYGLEHFWFLQALFLLMVSYSLLEWIGALNSFQGWAITFAITVVISFFLPTPHFFSMDRAVHHSCFFIMGVGAARFPNYLLRRSTAFIGLGLIILAVILFELHDLHTNKVHPHGIRFLSLMASTGLITSFFHFRLVIPWFSALAPYSYTIYLFHYLGLSFGTRVSRKLLAGGDQLLILIVDVTLAVICSIIIHKVVTSNRYLSFLFLGSRLKRKPKESKSGLSTDGTPAERSATTEAIVFDGRRDGQTIGVPSPVA